MIINPVNISYKICHFCKVNNVEDNNRVVCHYCWYGNDPIDRIYIDDPWYEND